MQDDVFLDGMSCNSRRAHGSEIQSAPRTQFALQCWTSYVLTFNLNIFTVSSNAARTVQFVSCPGIHLRKICKTRMQWPPRARNRRGSSFTSDFTRH